MLETRHGGLRQWVGLLRRDDTSLNRAIEAVLGAPLRIPVRWATHRAPRGGDGPVLLIKPRALRQMLWAPGEIGLARAWVTGDIDVPGDLYAALSAARDAIDGLRGARPLGPVAKARLAGRVLGTALLAGGIGAPPPRPPEEAVLSGRRHVRARDSDAVRHHYDVGNEFYRLVLGESMSYSAGYWPDIVTPNGTTEPDQPLAVLRKGLADAQEAKHALILDQLGAGPGTRMLDVGCGWGGLVVAAARRGAHATGVTLSPEQARYAVERAREAGVADQVDIRVQDYRDIRDERFDVIASIGMAEHVGTDQLPGYARSLRALLHPGGRLLNSAISRPHRPGRYRLDPFIQRYVFPDGELQPLTATVDAVERAGMEVRMVRSLREHYALTLRAWVGNLEAHWERAVELVGAGRARVWRLYMAASALQFESGALGVNQVVAGR